MSQAPARARLSWPREVMSSLVKILPRWYWTVRGDRNRRVPISGFDSPSAASGGGLIILAAVAWIARLRGGPRKAVGAQVSREIVTTAVEP